MQKWDRSRRLVFCLLLAGSICAGAVLCSCRRLADSKQPAQPRNLTPGLSEELIALAKRHRGFGFVFLTDRSGSSEEARNLTALMAKALGDGGWPIIRNKEMGTLY